MHSTAMRLHAITINTKPLFKVISLFKLLPENYSFVKVRIVPEYVVRIMSCLIPRDLLNEGERKRKEYLPIIKTFTNKTAFHGAFLSTVVKGFTR